MLTVEGPGHKDLARTILSKGDSAFMKVVQIIIIYILRMDLLRMDTNGYEFF